MCVCVCVCVCVRACVCVGGGGSVHGESVGLFPCTGGNPNVPPLMET